MSLTKGRHANRAAANRPSMFSGKDVLKLKPLENISHVFGPVR